MTFATMREGEMRQDERRDNRYIVEARALGLALQDALRDIVKAEGLTYLDTFLERQLQGTVEALRSDNGLNIPGVRAAHRSTADEAEAALRREIEAVRTNPARKQLTTLIFCGPETPA
jgi:hypothetical protein